MENNKNRDWTNEETFLLIDCYKETPRLWDPKHKEYKVKSKRHHDWKRISQILHCNVTIVKKKMESLLTSFRRERQRCKDANKSAVEINDIYKSKWFAFDRMKFLLHKFASRKALDTMETMEDSWEITLEDFTEKKELNSLTPATMETFQSENNLNHIDIRNLEQRAEEAYNNMQQAVKRQVERDASATFGEHIANKHRSYSSRTKTVVEHLFANILFEADMGRFDAINVFDAASTYTDFM